MRPGDYLRGAYALLAEKLPADLSGELAKPERVARAVKATAEASILFLRNQCGPTLDLLVRALGPDVWTLLHDRVMRSTVPRRFRGLARSWASRDCASAGCRFVVLIGGCRGNRLFPLRSSAVVLLLVPNSGFSFLLSNFH